MLVAWPPQDKDEGSRHYEIDVRLDLFRWRGRSSSGRNALVEDDHRLVDDVGESHAARGHQVVELGTVHERLSDGHLEEVRVQHHLGLDRGLGELHADRLLAERSYDGLEERRGQFGLEVFDLGHPVRQKNEQRGVAVAVREFEDLGRGVFKFSVEEVAGAVDGVHLYPGRQVGSEDSLLKTFHERGVQETLDT